MSRLARPAERITTGTQTLGRRIAARTTAWCARGRRDDLTGWRAILGVLARLALLALGIYLLARAVRALPNLLWLLSSAWVAGAWRAGRAATPQDDAEPPAGEAPAGPSGDAVRALLLEVMGDAPAVHLRTVLAHLQERGHGADWTVADLRARVEALGIPVPKVKVPGSKSPTRGVRRVDLAPTPGPAQETSTEASTAA